MNRGGAAYTRTHARDCISNGLCAAVTPFSGCCCCTAASHSCTRIYRVRMVVPRDKSLLSNSHIHTHPHSHRCKNVFFLTRRPSSLLQPDVVALSYVAAAGCSLNRVKTTRGPSVRAVAVAPHVRKPIPSNNSYRMDI